MDDVDHVSHGHFPTKKEQVINDFRNFSSGHLCLYSKSRNFDMGHPHENVSKLFKLLSTKEILLSTNETLESYGALGGNYYCYYDLCEIYESWDYGRFIKLIGSRSIKTGDGYCYLVGVCVYN